MDTVFKMDTVVNIDISESELKQIDAVCKKYSKHPTQDLSLFYRSILRDYWYIKISRTMFDNNTATEIRKKKMNDFKLFDLIIKSDNILDVLVKLFHNVCFYGINRKKSLADIEKTLYCTQHMRESNDGLCEFDEDTYLSELRSPDHFEKNDFALSIKDNAIKKFISNMNYFKMLLFENVNPLFVNSIIDHIMIISNDLTKYNETMFGSLNGPTKKIIQETIISIREYVEQACYFGIDLKNYLKDVWMFV
jgi:hypothetical protein